MNYESGHTGLISNREIEPYTFSANYADVYAYEISTGQNKIFKICRIGWVKPTSYEWEHEDKHEVISPDCFRMSGFEQTPIKLELSLRAKNLLIEEYPLAQKDLKEVEGKWILETMVSDMAGVTRFVIGLADEIKIIDSPALEEYTRNFVQKYFLKKI